MEMMFSLFSRLALVRVWFSNWHSWLRSPTLDLIGGSFLKALVSRWICETHVFVEQTIWCVSLDILCPLDKGGGLKDLNASIHVWRGPAQQGLWDTYKKLLILQLKHHISVWAKRSDLSWEEMLSTNVWSSASLPVEKSSQHLDVVTFLETQLCPESNSMNRIGDAKPRRWMLESASCFFETLQWMSSNI